MKQTTDIWFSAFLMLKGIKVEKFETLSRGKGKYFFNMNDADWQKYKLEFNNSELVKYKTAIEQLKDLLY